MKSLRIILAATAAPIALGSLACCSAEEGKQVFAAITQHGQERASTEYGTEMPAETKEYSFIVGLNQPLNELEPLCQATGAVSCSAQMSDDNNEAKLTLAFDTNDAVTPADVAHILEAEKSVAYAEQLTDGQTEVIIRSSSTSSEVLPVLAQEAVVGPEIYCEFPENTAEYKACITPRNVSLIVGWKEPLNAEEKAKVATDLCWHIGNQGECTLTTSYNPTEITFTALTNMPNDQILATLKNMTSVRYVDLNSDDAKPAKRLQRVLTPQ
ncbi:MAG: hypothetical protein CMH30_02775 [Micavibrio sp.]|nr:hypothetical protein [Micavibrio sp.]|tara:strand:+ start:1257 stop:2063 length:807 start_codon:yes stop_codon:yes gene_type:complete